MNRDITEIVVHMPEALVNELLQLLEECTVTIIRPPRSALVMMPLIDSFQSEFNLGEVLVTEAMVAVDNMNGYGMVIGDSPRRALARAAATAVLKGENCQIREKVELLLITQETKRKAELSREQSLTATTRGNFDLMAGA